MLLWMQVGLLSSLAALAALSAAAQSDESISGEDATALTYHYNHDVRPILAENCFSCHGPDASKRKAHLALHERDSALAMLEPGIQAIVPGNPHGSEVMRRILSSEADVRMPPPDGGHHLTTRQIAILGTWIQEGAHYQMHWSYAVPHPVGPPMPGVRGGVPADGVAGGELSPIDAYITDRLSREGLTLSPQADPVTLIRRLSFDLIGLPPTTQEVDAFLDDHAPDAYARMVDRFLASPQYGERMAVGWLDLVRYADSVGYHSDNARNVTPYRDWVIAAFNSNLPFDEFTREQLAGDLQPNSSLAQKVASTYNRLLMTTEEVGAQPGEYEAKSAADRVRNVSSVWLGSTMRCCECHDHKYDPFTARDFYNMEAFFSDIQESAIGPREKGMPVPTSLQAEQLAALDARLAGLRTILDTPTAQLQSGQARWEIASAPLRPLVLGRWHRLGPFHAVNAHAAFSTAFDPETAVDLLALRTDHLAWTAEPAWRDGEVHTLAGGDYCATYLFRTITCAAPETVHLSLGSDDTITVWLNERLLLAHEVSHDAAPDQEQLEVPLPSGTNRLLMKIGNVSGGYAYYFKLTPQIPDQVATLLAVPSAARDQAATTAIAAYYRSISPLLAQAREDFRQADQARSALLEHMEHTLVTVSGPPRSVRVKARGNWMDAVGPPCTPSVPHFLQQLAVQGRATRLDLANWLVSPENPLVARVMVNRLWKQFFGVGLVKTLEDFGTQGDPPSNQALLDYLAVDFSTHGWDIKRSIRNMLLSHAYRQSSLAGTLVERDPDNRLVGRQSRFRLDAEFVRDTALSISGLLVDRIGGPSVKPYQPAGYWTLLNFPPREWVDDQGQDAYRRGLYTFWQRTLLHPSLLAFDAPSREECTVERARSNTPQQALVLLNDPTYVEAARCFAEEMIRQGGADDGLRVCWGYRRALSRLPTADELDIHLRLLDGHRALYRDSPESAALVSHIGQHPPPADIDVCELAAWTSVARVILNLYDTISRN